ncbi:poly(rC)-binding protein 3-like isoform X1 [Styela clava]
MNVPVTVGDNLVVNQYNYDRFFKETELKQFCIMPDVIITIRMLMVGKEIGAIIGKGGATIASFRQKSGAKINVSTSSGTPERIVTVTGEQSQIREAFRLITQKIEEDTNSNVSSSVLDRVPVTLVLIVPASQCGSIIGKAGSKIKEIRETSACAIKVGGEMLPGSTERPVTLNGTPSAIVKCVDLLCEQMIQFPAKTATVPYKPNMGYESVVFHQGQAYMLQGQYAIPNPDITKLHQIAAMHSYTEDKPGSSLMGNFTSFATPSKGSGHGEVDAGVSGSVNLPTKVLDADTQEITVSNDTIGCIIGRGGTRINEIRLMSGAQISINRSLDKESKADRKITITGTPESISLAQYLINTSIQLFANQKPSKSSSDTTNSTATTSASEDGESSTSTTNPQPLMSVPTRPASKPIPISQLFGPSSFGSAYMAPRIPFGGPFGAGIVGPYPGHVGIMGPGASFSAAMQNARRAFMSRSRYTGFSNRPRHNYNRRNKEGESSSPKAEEEEEGDVSPPGESSPNGKDKRKTKREKFQPY